MALKTAVLSDKTIEVAAWPNPVQNTLNYVINAESEDEYEATLYSMTGIQLQAVLAEAGAEYSMDVSGLPAGNYYLKINTPKQQFIQRIIKK